MMEEDLALARSLANAAGEMLMAIRCSGVVAGKGLGTVGDRTANAFLVESLRARRPNDGLLTEEEADDLLRLERDRVWIIDPLDGSREFYENRSDWAVHVGLSIEGVPVVGAVALPAIGVTLCSGSPATLTNYNGQPRMLVSRTRPAQDAVEIARKLDAVLMPMGSAGAKAMAVVRGQAEIYLHSGGQYEWDNCAPAAVASAAGLHVSRLDGSPLQYNQANPYLPDLLICRPEFAERILTEYRRPPLV